MISQWLITHLGRNQYKIQNADFSSFASYDTRPQVEDPVLGKSGAIPWTIRLAQSPNAYKWVLINWGLCVITQLSQHFTE